jgi:hypothetical protein
LNTRLPEDFEGQNDGQALETRAAVFIDNGAAVRREDLAPIEDLFHHKETIVNP